MDEYTHLKEADGRISVSEDKKNGSNIYLNYVITLINKAIGKEKIVYTISDPRAYYAGNNLEDASARRYDVGSLEAIAESDDRSEHQEEPENRNSYQRAIAGMKQSLNEFVDDKVFVKESLGKDGKTIRVYKFRTMVPNADKMFTDMIKNNGVDQYGNIKNDNRITPIGKILRTLWIDELPQVYNILKGEMKLVGIRPMSKKHWKNYPSLDKERALKQKPGLFGVNYAVPWNSTAEETFKKMNDYLLEHEKHPLRTDTKYFGIISYNIARNLLLHGKMSS